MKYEPLTKIIADDSGKEFVTCKFYGTTQCRCLHTGGCIICPMLAAILNQLHAFEENYINLSKEDDHFG